MAGLSIIRRLLWTLLLAGGAVLPLARGAPGEVLRVTQNIAGDSKPVLLYADEIATWTVGTQRVIVLKGTVFVEQGVVNAQMQGAVALVNLGLKQQAGVLRVRVYAEGDVRLESGPEFRRGPKAVLELNTRGELKLKSQYRKIVQQALPNEPLYQNALAELGIKTKPAAVPAVQPASAVERAPARPFTPPALTAPTAPGALPGGSTPSPTVPLGSGPAIPGAGYVVPPSPLPPPPPPVLKRMSSHDLTPGESVIIRAQAPAPAVEPPPAGAPPAGITGPTPYNTNPLPAGVTPSVPSLGPPIPGPPVPEPPPAGPAPSSAPGPPPSPPPPPATPPAPPTTRNLRIVPRYSTPIDVADRPLPSGEKALVITGGIILTVQAAAGLPGLVDIEADVAVYWSHDKNATGAASGLLSPQGQNTQDGEFYLAGNVEIRERTLVETRALRADEVYYDVGRSVAVARHADLELQQTRPGAPPYPIHFRADEILQLSANEFKGYRAEVFSSSLPSDPGLKVYLQEADLETKVVPRRSIFGRQYINRITGQPETETQRLIHARNVFLEVEDVPIFYSPILQGDANDPLGPLHSINFKYDRIFGFQTYLTFNVYDLIGMDPLPGTRWTLDTDYLTRRGPGLGTDFEYSGKDLFDLTGHYEGWIRAYGINDKGSDILGGGRGEFEPHPDNRGRFQWRHLQELPDDLTLQAQVSLLSDKNFLEQYLINEYQREYNQETFLYLKQQRGDWAWTALAEGRTRIWVTEADHLPEVNGYLIGHNLFDWLTYDARVSAGYYQLKPAKQPPLPYAITDKQDETGRFDFSQELSLPFALGPIKLAPYAVLDLTYYTNDLTGTDRGRVYEGGGVRASMPLTRLYPDIQNELLNLNGINHKIVLSSNIYLAHSDTSYTRLPQIDRLNDDISDQALRDIRADQIFFNPAHGPLLVNSPLYDPQLYAIHQLVENRIDTLDSVEAFEFDVRQRWQTKRGYPGQQHIVDWMTLDLSGSYYTDASGDFFGNHFSTLQYYWLWNIGDRTSLESTGWAEPESPGARIFTFGAYFNRPDRTNYFIGYRDIFPLNSRAVSASIQYIFSPKYSLTFNATYDFGINSQSNSVVLTRMGSDLQVSLGINYNSILNNFGVTFEIFPTLVPENRRVVGATSSLFNRQ